MFYSDIWQFFIPIFGSNLPARSNPDPSEMVWKKVRSGVLEKPINSQILRDFFIHEIQMALRYEILPLVLSPALKKVSQRS